jgi:hypothetical protein
MADRYYIKDSITKTAIQREREKRKNLTLLGRVKKEVLDR